MGQSTLTNKTRRRSPSQGKVRKVLTVEQITNKFDKIKKKAIDYCRLVQEKTQELENAIRTYKILFGHVPSEVSDDFIKFYQDMHVMNDEISKDLLSVNIYDERDNLRKDCQDVSDSAWAEDRKFQDAGRNFHKALDANKEILFPSISNGLLVELRRGKKQNQSHWDFILNGDLEMDCLAQKVGVVFQEPNCEPLPNREDFEEWSDFFTKQEEVIKKNWNLKQDALKAYRTNICRNLAGVAPRVTKDFNVYEWRLREGKVLQFFVARNKKNKNNLKLKGNVKNNWLHGRMFFMEGIMITWVCDKKGNIKPSVIPGGTPDWPMSLVDVLTNEVLKQA